MADKTIKAREMLLADTVQMVAPDGPWRSCIVQQITDTHVVLFRPYGATTDFSYAGGVICYIGIETYTVALDSTLEYELLQRKALL